MKCLPATKLAESQGVGLHDWHAEVLAIRAFNRYLLDASSQVSDLTSSNIVMKNGDGLGHTIRKPFRINPNVKLHMYCSEAPCKYQFFDNI